MLDRSPDFGTGIMFIYDHKSGLSLSRSALLQKSRHISSKSQDLYTSGGISSGPAALHNLSEDLTFRNSSIVNISSLISRSL